MTNTSPNKRTFVPGAGLPVDAQAVLRLPASQPAVPPGATSSRADVALPRSPGATGPAVLPLPRAIADLELQAIRAALDVTGGNKLAASKLLGISRATLYEKLGRLIGKAAT